MSRRNSAVWIALAVMSFALVAGIIFSVYQIRANTNRIARDAEMAQANATRSCEAIRGATLFWKDVRSTTKELLQDPSLSPSIRNSSERYVVALTHVINLAETLQCDGASKK